MLAFDLKQDSWHMRVANFGNVRIGEYMKREGTDICTYTRAFMIGAALLTFCIIALSLFATLIVSGLYGIFAYFFGSLAEMPPESVMLIGVVIGLSLLASLITITTKISDYRREKRHKAYKDSTLGLPPPTPGFLTLAYRKFKDKTCFKINFVKED